MRILAMTGFLLPIPSNNANLLLRLLPFLAGENEVRLLSTIVYDQTDDLPREIGGIPVYWVKRGTVSTFRRKLAFPVASRLLDPSGNSDLVNELYVSQTLREIRANYPYDAILSQLQARLPGKRGRKFCISWTRRNEFRGSSEQSTASTHWIRFCEHKTAF